MRNLFSFIPLGSLLLVSLIVSFLRAVQIPVSGNSNIEITSELDGGTLKASTGEVSWKLNVEPSGTAKKTLSYKVKYPKDWDLNIE